MTQLTVKEAADKVGVTRQWLFRLIREGKLSATLSRDGKKQVDVSELIRVFGELQPNTQDRSYSVDKRSLSPKLSNLSTTTALQIELERLKSALEFKQAELALAIDRIQELKDRELQVKERERDLADERNRLIGIIEQQNRLLAAPDVKVSKKVTKPKAKTGSR